MKLKKAIRILLVDDFELIRTGLRDMLTLEEDMDVVGDCDAKEASSRIARLHPDVVLTGMPGIIRSLKRNHDYVIVLADSLDYRAEALKAGVAIYLLKDVTRVELARAIRQVYLSNEEAVELVISPRDNVAQLLRFMCQLDDFASITWEAVSRNCAVVTILTQPTTSSSILSKLANMPEVDKVEELTGDAFSSLPKRFEFLLRLGISPSKRFSVTLPA